MCVCVCVCAPFILWSTPLQFFSFNNSCVITIVEIPAKVSTAFMYPYVPGVRCVCVCVCVTTVGFSNYLSAKQVNLPFPWAVTTGQLEHPL